MVMRTPAIFPQRHVTYISEAPETSHVMPCPVANIVHYYYEGHGAAHLPELAEVTTDDLERTYRADSAGFASGWL